MATAPQGLALFPGVAQAISGEITLSHGISPSVGTIEMVPQPNFAGDGGTLSFTFGGVEIDFPDCKVDQASLKFDANGFLIALSIFDRRWKWSAGGTISGNYNVRADDGTIDPIRQQDAPTLCSMCLDAMGEGGYDVSGVPGDVHPYVDWDHDNPARCLADLADQLGCRIVLGIDNTVSVVPLGQGADLPVDDTVMANSLTINPPEIPDSLLVVGGVSRFQMDFLLQAVGLETDGSIKPIYELSYYPGSPPTTQAQLQQAILAAGGNFNQALNAKLNPILNNNGVGWSSPEFYNVAEIWRDLARQSVFKWYRIYGNCDGTSPPIIPGYGPVFSGQQVLPIEDEQVLTYADGGPGVNQQLTLGPAPLNPPNALVPNPLAPDAAEEFVPVLLKNAMQPGYLKRNLPAIVYGIYSDGRSYQNTASGTLYDRPFKINREKGIVEFDECLQMNSNPPIGPDGLPVNNWAPSSAEWVPALLYLRCAVSVRDPRTWAFHRYEKLLDLGGTWGTGPRVLKHDDLVLNVVGQMNDRLLQYTAVFDNTEDLDATAQDYLGQAMLEYQIKTPQSIAYAGLIPISPDGAIQQVSWRVGPSGAETQASRNNEFSPIVPGYQERRIWEQVRGGQLANVAKVAQRVQRAAIFKTD